MIGKPMPHAFIINYGDWGYAKFLIDERSQVALEQDINKVEDLNERKFIYNILFDAVKSKKQPGSRILQMLINNLPGENSESVLLSGLKLVSQIIDFFIPNEQSTEKSIEVYETIMKILESKKFIASDSTS